MPYGFIILIGGVIGYLRRGSMNSLVAGGGTGLLLILAGYLSLQAFHKRMNSYFAWILETGNQFVSIYVLLLLNFMRFDLVIVIS